MALALQEMLQALTQMQINLMVNDNRSTMISILERKRKYIRLSLHQMFLEAPNEVIIALSELLKNKRSKSYNQILRQFINLNSQKYDREYSVNKDRLSSKGEFFDLGELYQKVNQHYFESKLDLHITWFGQGKKRPRHQISFGLYHEPLKLIKINRLLDRKETPSYFVEYIVYHEMLHEVYRPETRNNGYRCVHTKIFKEKEKEFHAFSSAKEWEEKFKSTFFTK